MSLRPCLFLDRDGVINHDPGDYTKNLSEFRILPTVMPALQMASDAGFEIILITNQGGIAKGLYSHEDVAAIHSFLREQCEKNGTPVLDIFYSPHHPSTGHSLSRKPGSLMVERACAKHQLDPEKSWMVGDKQRDLDAAAPIGVRGVLIKPNAPLLEAVQDILSQTPQP